MIRLIMTIMSFAGFLISGVNAQNSSTSSVPPTTGTSATSMESTGTITEYTPDSSLVMDTGSGEPVHFTFGRNVTYVGADGQPIQASGLRKNLRVRVHYIIRGGDKIIDKVALAE